MLDIKYIRENADIVKKAVHDKQLTGSVNIDKLLELDEKYRQLLQNVETHRALRNQLSKDIPLVSADEREKLIEEATKVKEELASYENEFSEIETERDNLLLKVPNIISEDVPYGVGEEDNVVIRTIGKPREFDFTPKDHIELGESLNLIDIKKASEVSGSRFNFLLNEAVLMQFALIQFVFDTLTSEQTVEELAKSVNNPSFKTFTPVLPPVFVRTGVMDKMDRLQPTDERYVFERDDIVLIGSAEHTLGPLQMHESLSDPELPIRYIGYSTAFRREAGSYGKDTRGILRVHQFDKLEMESFTTPEMGQAEQNLMVAIQEYFLQKLELPYQVIAISSGDMGKPDFRQVDINTWMPGYSAYRETHTSDYMTDFQSRRLNIAYESGGYVYMNDATAIAIGRTLIAILENYQQKDGSVIVPEVLRKYMGKDVIRAK